MRQRGLGIAVILLLLLPLAGAWGWLATVAAACPQTDAMGAMGAMCPMKSGMTPAMMAAMRAAPGQPMACCRCQLRSQPPVVVFRLPLPLPPPRRIRLARQARSVPSLAARPSTELLAGFPRRLDRPPSFLLVSLAARS